MRNQILEDLKTAMKQRDKLKLSVIRMVKSAIQMKELDLKRELNDDEVIEVISKQIKTRNDSIKEFEKASRDDLIETTSKEIEILKTYLPKQLSEEEINDIIDKVFDEVKPESSKDMGKVMKEISPLVKGKADMGMVSSIIKSRLK
ncbi:MAG: GatB/YqeY domain-containing protein [Bacilli bacterium]|nr:GatB/YqeY domain-containing protein [Bacilli bacterium]